MNKVALKSKSVTVNACKLCTPLGACLAMKGIEQSMLILHGSQGCSTYIRRYMIGHFREPVDIASTNFSENTAIFGGEKNLLSGIDNIIKQYSPEMICVASTCLSETIGEDVEMFLRKYKAIRNGESIPPLFYVSTPSYNGTHIDGFHAVIKKVVKEFAENKTASGKVNIFPGMVSPADMRHLKEILNDFDIPYVMLPDYSDTLDGQLWEEYHKIPAGGTSWSEIEAMGSARASIELGAGLAARKTAGKYLEETFNCKLYSCGMPVGVRETDKFFTILEQLSGKDMPEKYQRERGRLIDAYADAHKHVFGLKAAVYGEEDLVVALASFLSEIGIEPVICATGGRSSVFEEKIQERLSAIHNNICCITEVDFNEIKASVSELKPDILIGNSKGYSMSRELMIPLVRVGFPVHDRIDGQRKLHIGYRGAQALFDEIVNTIIAIRQDESPVGYATM